MGPKDLKNLKIKIFLLFPLAFVVLAAILMLTAGSFKYWPGWVYCAVIIAPAFFVVMYFLKRSPEFLERRMKFKEKEVKQKAIVKTADLFFSIGFLMPGLDWRFGWSGAPLWLIIASNIMVLASYFLVFLAFRENVFAGRTVEIFEGQKVIDGGPYAIVRHPMYSGLIPMFLFTPLALGSFWALLLMIPVVAAIIIRTLDEEKFLRRDLPGYGAYCAKVRYRLVPGIW